MYKYVVAQLLLLTIVSSAIAAVSPEFEGRLKRIEVLLQMQVDTDVYPGIAVSVVYKDQVLLERGFGYANIEWKAEASADTVFEIGSITKTFTGIAIAQLVEAGRLSLDDSIEKFILNYPVHKKKIRIRHLLNHTSGIPNFTRIPAVYKHLHSEVTNNELVEIFKDLPLDFKPGEQFKYSNSGTYLLGMIIEIVSNLSYGEYIEKNILKPFGMHQSGFQNHRKIIPNRAQGYVSMNTTIANAQNFNPVMSFSAGGLVSTVIDLQRYITAIHTKTGKLTPSVRSQIFRQIPLADGTLPKYTLGCLRVSDQNGHKKFWHSGSTIAFSSQIAYYPNDHLSIVILTNKIASIPSAPTPQSLEKEIARIILGVTPIHYDITDPTATGQ